MARKEKNEYIIQSVSFACSLLEQFHGEVRELNLTELSRLLRISKNNVFRLLATLEARNFIERNPSSGAYRLGLTTLRMGEAYVRSKRLVQEAHPFLEDVSRQSLETVFLGVWGTEGLVCEDIVKSILPVRVECHEGTSFPLHCTAAGKLMLAFGSEKELRAFFERENSGRCSEEVAISTRTLAKELRDVREGGYAICVDEFEAGASAVAAPVRNHASRVIGVIGLVGPSFRLARERLDGEFAPLVMRAAREISLRMGNGEPVEEKSASQGKHPYIDVSQCGAPPGLMKEKSPAGDRGPVNDLLLQSERLNASPSQAEIVAAQRFLTLSGAGQ